MRIYSTPITNYRNANKAFWPIHFISFLVKDTDDPDLLTRANFCTSDDDMTVTITDPDSGDPDERTFAGGGHIVKMGDLVRLEGAIIRTIRSPCPVHQHWSKTWSMVTTVGKLCFSGSRVNWIRTPAC
jgi:hypothetical protein